MYKYSTNILIFQLIFLISFGIYTSTSLVILPIGVATYLLIYFIYVGRLFFLRKVTLKKTNSLDWLILIFIVINIFSIFNVIILNYSLDVYLKGISYCLFPIVGYFIFSFSGVFNYSKINGFLSVLLVTTIFSILIGLYLFLFQPPFYVSYILKSSDGIISETDDLFQIRLLSYYGDPTLVGNISAVSLPIYFYLRDSKIKYFESSIIRTIVPIIIVSGVILSFARSAWLATLVIIILQNIKGSVLKSIKFISIICLIFFIFFLVGANVFDNTLFDLLLDRGSNIFTSFNERSGQTEWAISIFQNNPLGIGLGQAGHKSFTGDISKGVYDNNYLRILVELGIQGALFFLLILIVSISLAFRGYRTWVDKKIYFLIGCILFIYSFQAIGSNIIDLHYSSFLFWSFIGILSLLTKTKVSRLENSDL